MFAVREIRLAVKLFAVINGAISSTNYQSKTIFHATYVSKYAIGSLDTCVCNVSVRTYIHCCLVCRVHFP